MLDEVSYIFKVIITKKHPKLIFRELVSHWNSVSSQWVVPNEIWYAIDKHDIVTHPVHNCKLLSALRKMNFIIF